MRKLAILLAVLAMAASVQASTMLQYKILVNGKDLAEASATDLPAAVGGISTFTVTIQALVTGTPGGLLQASFDLNDSTGTATTSALNPVVGTGSNATKWTGTTVTMPARTKGQVIVGGASDVLAETDCANASPDNYGDVWNTYAVGSYQTIVTGSFKWDVTKDATLTLATTLGKNLVWNGDGDTGISDYPASVVTDSVHFVVPEPVTMALLAIGGLGMLARRNRR